MATRTVEQWEEVQNSLDVTDPPQAAQWFHAEIHRLGLIAGNPEPEDGEVWDDLEPDFREALACAFSNYLREVRVAWRTE